MPESDNPERQPLRIQMPVDVRTASLAILTVVAIIFALRSLQEAFIPIVLAILISYALDPLVTWLHRLYVPRVIGAAIVLGVVVAGVGTAAYALQDEAVQIVNELPQAARRLRRTLQQSRGAFEKVQKAATEIERTAATAAEATAPAAAPPKGVMRVQIEQPQFRASDYLWWGSRGAVAASAQIVMILFLVYFLLISGDLYKRKLVRIAGPSPEAKQVTVQILDEVNGQIERFLLVQIFAAVVVWLTTWLALRLVGVAQAPVWGILAGIFNTIPYFGPVVVSAGLTIVAYMQFGTIGMALVVAAIALAITSLEGWLLTPALVGRAARMNQAAVLIGLIVGGVMWGVWGVLLAAPIMMVVKAICDRVENLQPIGELLGE